VIATGFKTDQPQRRDRAVSSAQAAISSSRTASAYQQPVAVAARPVAAGNGHAMAMAATRTAAPTRERPSLESVKEAVKGVVEQDDLDVPAFIRKRAEN
jgi:hypothetical protein